MSFGIQVMTSTGQLNSDVLNTYGIVKVVNILTETGSMSVPEFDSNVGFFHPIISDNIHEQAFLWNNSTKVMTWSRASAFSSRVHSSNFYLYFFRGVSQ